MLMDVLPPDIKKKSTICHGTSAFGLLLCSVAGMYEGPEEEVGEGTELLWYAYHTSTATQNNK